MKEGSKMKLKLKLKSMGPTARESVRRSGIEV